MDLPMSTTLSPDLIEEVPTFRPAVNTGSLTAACSRAVRRVCVPER